MQPNQPYWQQNPDDVSSDETPEQPRGPVVTMSAQAPSPREAASIASVPQEPVRWQASEYIHQEKNGLWFTAFGIIVLGLMAVAIFVMQAWTFAVLIAVMAAAVIVYASRPPRVLTYTLSEKGLYVGDRLYDFTEFKSFGVIRDGAEFSIMLIPTHRFKPGVTVYFPEQSGEQIVDRLGSRLPMQELHLDVIDKVVRKLRL